MKTRLRDAASWLPLAAGASSHNLAFTFYLSTVLQRILDSQIMISGSDIALMENKFNVKSCNNFALPLVPPERDNERVVLNLEIY